MPLAHGYSFGVIRKNIERMILEGRSASQASAIAYERAREWFELRHPGKKIPKHLQRPHG